jgi:hypothetical protein
MAATASASHQSLFPAALLIYRYQRLLAPLASSGDASGRGLLPLLYGCQDATYRPTLEVVFLTHESSSCCGCLPCLFCVVTPSQCSHTIASVPFPRPSQASSEPYSLDDGGPTDLSLALRSLASELTRLGATIVREFQLATSGVYGPVGTQPTGPGPQRGQWRGQGGGSSSGEGNGAAGRVWAVQPPRAAAVAFGVGNVKRTVDLVCGPRATDDTRAAVWNERGLETAGQPAFSERSLAATAAVSHTSHP